MKKLMLSAFVTVLAMVSCNKQETTPLNDNLKTVEISLENIMFATKGPGVSEDLENTEVALKTIQFFFTDGTSFYTPKEADGTTDAKVYYSANETIGRTFTFHYLSSAVNKVIVIGNYRENDAYVQLAPASRVDLDKTLRTENEQDPYNLTLYASGDVVTKASADHNTGENAHPTDVYTVSLNLMPRVARFEIQNIGCNFTTETSVEISHLIFGDYYQLYNLASNTPGTGSLRSMPLTNDTEAFNYIATKTSPYWDCDMWPAPNQLVLKNEAGQTSKAVNLAYNFFPSAGAMPRFLVNATINNNNPAYLFTRYFTKNDGAMLDAGEEFLPGHIYRIQNFTFTDTDFNRQERCLDITLTVHKWQVIYVTPHF